MRHDLALSLEQNKNIIHLVSVSAAIGIDVPAIFCGFALQQRLRRRRPELGAFYGQDLHWKKQYRGLFVELHSAAAEPPQILAALRVGSYSGRKAELELPSSGVLPPETLAEFSEAQRKSRRVRSFLSGGKKMLDRVGVKIPPTLKAQLRRIF